MASGVQANLVRFVGHGEVVVRVDATQMRSLPRYVRGQVLELVADLRVAVPKDALLE